MNNRMLLLLGGVIPILFALAILGLSTMIESYSHVSQTVSEIGSPAELHWKIADVMLSVWLLLFSLGIYRFCVSNSLSVLPAYFLAYFGLMSIGISIFESPHPLHNVFGLTMILGYMAPLVLALSWRRQKWAKSLLNMSWVIWVLVVVSMFLNLSPLFIQSLYPLEYYGLVQRSLFLVFYGVWCPAIGFTLYRASADSSKLNCSNTNTETNYV